MIQSCYRKEGKRDQPPFLENTIWPLAISASSLPNKCYQFFLMLPAIKKRFNSLLWYDFFAFPPPCKAYSKYDSLIHLNITPSND